MERLPSFAEHPTLRLNLAQPVSHRGNPAEVFEYMLLTDEPHGKNLPVKIVIVVPKILSSM